MSIEHDRPAAITANVTAGSEAEKFNDEEEIVYMGHWKFSIIFAALCLSVFQVALVSIASPHWNRFNASIAKNLCCKDEVIVATVCLLISPDVSRTYSSRRLGSSYYNERLQLSS